MVEKIKARVQELLTSGKIKGFLGLRERYGHVGPYLFTDPNDLDGMSVGDGAKPGDTRYSLNKQLIRLVRSYQDDVFGVLVRGCDERGLKTLIASNQLDPARVVPVGLACPQELADACECMKPYPDEYVAGEQAEGRPFAGVAQIEAMAMEERFKVWLAEFAKCVKCYGCRDVCPMCYCKECTLGGKDFVNVGTLPPQNPIFHITRALHMAGRCIDCGLCNEACPADIPLRTLYKKIADLVDQEYQYRPGYGEPKASLTIHGLGDAPQH